MLPTRAAAVMATPTSSRAANLFDFPLFSFNGGLCVAALWVATFVRRGKWDAVGVAACLLANYLFCALAYTPYAPKYAFHAIGIPVTSKDLWLVADTLFGCAAMLVGFWHRWAVALWALACVQVGTHLAYQAQAIDEYVYSDALQIVLHAQLAVFFVIGGPRAWDYLRSSVSRYRRSRGSMAVQARDEATG